jgi:uncharacterized protein (TIRG00374 family)
MQLAGSGLVLALVLCRVGVRDVLANLSNLAPAFILFGWAFYACCQLLSAVRWRLLLSAAGVEVPLPKLFGFYMIGMFLNNFLPGGVGGDVVKAYQLYRYTGQGRYAVASVFLERFTGLIGLVLLTAAALAAGLGRQQSPWVLVVVCGTPLLLALAAALLWWSPRFVPLLRPVGTLLPRKTGDKLSQLYGALASYRNHRKTLVLAIGLSAGIHFLYACLFALVAGALDTPINLRYFILFLPAITVANVAPVSLGGLGVREALMVMLFSEVRVPAADILAVSLTTHLLNMSLSLWGGALLVLRRPGSEPTSRRARSLTDPDDHAAAREVGSAARSPATER